MGFATMCVRRRVSVKDRDGVAELSVDPIVHWGLLGMYVAWKDRVFADTCLPFGLQLVPILADALHKT